MLNGKSVIEKVPHFLNNNFQVRTAYKSILMLFKWELDFVQRKSSMCKTLTVEKDPAVWHMLGIS